MRRIGLILLVAFTLVTPSAAQVPIGPNVLRSPAAPIGKPSQPLFPPDRKAPSSSVTAPAFGPLVMLPGTSQRPAAKIVCGMTMVPVDASLDPKIEHRVPSTGKKFTLKTVKPPMCGQ